LGEKLNPGKITKASISKGARERRIATSASSEGKKRKREGVLRGKRRTERSSIERLSSEKSVVCPKQHGKSKWGVDLSKKDHKSHEGGERAAHSSSRDNV